MKMAMTKMSTKGQVVIPADFRIGIKEGDPLLIIQTDEGMILKKTNQVAKRVAEDIAFAEKTDKALKRIEKGKGIRTKFDDVIKEMEKW